MISVLMPVYNNSEYLSYSIESILNQTYKDFEFIILNDGSTESSVSEILDRYSKKDKRIVIAENSENIGLTKSLNTCLDLAKGDVIARQDSDDISVPTRFEDQLKMFKDNVGLVSCYGYAVKGGKRTSNYYLDEVIRSDHTKEQIKTGNFILGAGSMYSRKVYEKIGYYDESLYIAQDYNYWIRILKYFDYVMVKKELYVVRKHPTTVRTRNHDRFKGIDWIKLCNERADECPVID